eukprot:scaffold266680_cov26-Tisochrysis_lutea.AAC.1
MRVEPLQCGVDKVLQAESPPALTWVDKAMAMEHGKVAVKFIYRGADGLLVLLTHSRMCHDKMGHIIGINLSWISRVEDSLLEFVNLVVDMRLSIAKGGADVLHAEPLLGKLGRHGTVGVRVSSLRRYGPGEGESDEGEAGDGVEHRCESELSSESKSGERDGREEEIKEERRRRMLRNERTPVTR